MVYEVNQNGNDIMVDRKETIELKQMLQLLCARLIEFPKIKV